MAALRDPVRGCPWDRQQTMTSLVPHTLEEAYEVAEAVEQGDLEAIRDELGDLLFQVVFYSRLAEERRAFDFGDVAEAVSDKLVRRHPHVFGEAVVASAADQARAWEDLKQRERNARAGGRAPGALDGVASSLPALSRAVKLQRRAARVGFDWRDPRQVLAKVEEELGELREVLDDGNRERLEHELGDVLLAVTNLARHLHIDPETALRRANRRFEQRFRYMESRLISQGREMSECPPEALEALWEEAKGRTEDPASS